MAEENKLNFQQHYVVGIQRADVLEDRRTATMLGVLVPSKILLSGEGCKDLRAGERIIVRTVHGGRAFGFETVVIEAPQCNVAPIAVAEMPAKIESLGLRKSDRINVLIPVDIRTQSQGDKADTLLLRGTVLNLSSGGVRLYTKMRVGKDYNMALSFTLPGAKNPVNISGVVLDSFQERSVFGQRVKFYNTEKNQKDLAEIRQWVNQHQEFAED